MSFKLLIECSKDIDELHINFSDGTSTVVNKAQTSQTTQTVQTKTPKTPKVEDSNKFIEPELNWEDYLQPISTEVVTLPPLS